MSDSHFIEPDYGTDKKTFGIYTLGIVLCILLTLIPFGAVAYNITTKGNIFAIIFVSATLQFFVQVICFLRLNTRTEQGKMNVMSFAFTIVILAAIVAGSLWIMWNLNYNMMH